MPDLQDNGFLSDVTSSVSRCYREYYAQDPLSARSGHLGEDLIATVLCEDHSAAAALEDLRRGEQRPDPRSEFQDAMQDRMIGIVEALSKRRVTRFVSRTRPSPRIEIELFILAAAGDDERARAGDEPPVGDRDRLLIAALSLLRGPEPDRVTVGEIARRARVAPIEFYSYFTTLDECLDSARGEPDGPR